MTTTASDKSHVLNAGYPITVGLGSLWAYNYTFNFVSGVLMVTPASLTITASSVTKVYGAVLPSLGVSYSGFVNGDTAANLTSHPTLATTATVSSHVKSGGYQIASSGASDPDYSITYVSGTLLIIPAPLTVTASNVTMVYGAALPALRASYSGLVNGDAAASLTTYRRFWPRRRPRRATSCLVAMPSSPRGPATRTTPSATSRARSSLPRLH